MSLLDRIERGDADSLSIDEVRDVTKWKPTHRGRLSPNATLIIIFAAKFAEHVANRAPVKSTSREVVAQPAMPGRWIVLGKLPGTLASQFQRTLMLVNLDCLQRLIGYFAIDAVLDQLLAQQP